MPPILHLAEELAAPEGLPRGHFLVSSSGDDWTGVQIAEWELRAEEWVDRHPHDEYNFVLEGTLIVSCDGETVEAPVGSLVHTPAGSTGRYSAPSYARMLGIYGPNATGADSFIGGLRKLENTQETTRSGREIG